MRKTQGRGSNGAAVAEKPAGAARSLIRGSGRGGGFCNRYVSSQKRFYR
jgi:hypothetical protein